MRLAIELLLCAALVCSTVFLDRVEIRSQGDLSEVTFGFPFDFVQQNQEALTPPLPWITEFQLRIDNHPMSIRFLPLLANSLLVFMAIRFVGGRIIPHRV